MLASMNKALSDFISSWLWTDFGYLAFLLCHLGTLCIWPLQWWQWSVSQTGITSHILTCAQALSSLEATFVVHLVSGNRLILCVDSFHSMSVLKDCHYMTFWKILWKWHVFFLGLLLLGNFPHLSVFWKGKMMDGWGIGFRAVDGNFSLVSICVL